METIETGAIEYTHVECRVYVAGFTQLKRTVPAGVRIFSVRVD